MYRSLNPDKIISTIEILGRRIEERFPSSGLREVCNGLYDIAGKAKKRSAWIARPNYVLRLCIAVIIVLSMAGFYYSLSLADISLNITDAGQIVQITEAGLNNVVLIGAALFFLVTLETRIKRTRALEALHELRTIAHVIDMHQLTKDPGKLPGTAVSTPSSPKRTMNAFELTRYLDYCSEMLSLSGKVAALYAQDFKDHVVLTSVNELETLTTGLSRKIWQKIMILYRLDDSNLTV